MTPTGTCGNQPRATVRVVLAALGLVTALLASACSGTDARPSAAVDAAGVTIDGSSTAAAGEGSGATADQTGAAAATGEAAAGLSPVGPPTTDGPGRAAAPAGSAAAPTTSRTATASGACGRAATGGAAPTVAVSEVALPTPVVGYGGEADTEPLPMAIAAAPSGRSWLAWLGTDQKVHLTGLGCDDQPSGPAVALDGVDLQDIQADATGVVVLLTRAGSCGTGPLCGNPSTAPCRTMWMVRVDSSGARVWERQVTNLTGGRTGYDDGARFVWWYQHHGRLATDGSNWAAYFGVAITVQNGGCVDIHEGDRMQVVDATGALVANHPDSFAVGCSHSWTTRLVWDSRTRHFVTTCATDNNCRIAQPDPYRTVASGACDGTLFGGDLVPSSGAGYWNAWSQGGQVRLAHFTTGAADRSVNPGAASRHPHLVPFGSRLLLAWGSGSGMAAQVLDAGTAAAVGGRITIAVPDHDYQAFKAWADGSAAYPAAGPTSRTIRVARVMPWSG